MIIKFIAVKQLYLLAKDGNLLLFYLEILMATEGFI